MTEDEYEAEIARLRELIAQMHEFTRRLAQRLFLAAEVLSIKAEKRQPKEQVEESSGRSRTTTST